MKLHYQQLEQHLIKQLAKIYFVSGDELLLTQEVIDLIRQTAAKAGFNERVRISAESNAEWAKQLYANSHSLSLFAEQRIVELDLRGAKLNQANSEMLVQYAENPPSHVLLLIYSNKLDKKSEQTRWYKAIEKSGVTIPIWPVTAEQLPQWIQKRAKKNNLALSHQAALWLAEQIEGNLLAAAQEIEKLCLLNPLGELDENALEHIIMNYAHFDVFNLVDSILVGDSKRSLTILKNLFDEDSEPTLILWALTRELRTMAELYRQTQQGVSLATLFAQFRIFEKRQPAVRAFQKRATSSRCWEWLLHASKIDRIIKGAEKGHIQDELEQLVLSMAASATNKQ